MNYILFNASTSNKLQHTFKDMSESILLCVNVSVVMLIYGNMFPTHVAKQKCGDVKSKLLSSYGLYSRLRINLNFVHEHTLLKKNNLFRFTIIEGFNILYYGLFNTPTT